MATDFQGVDIVAKTFPFQQQTSFNASRYSTVPWGQAIVNESFDTTTTGAGNDGLINIDVGLPADYVALMRTFSLQVVDTATVNWNEGVVGFAYQQPGGPYKESVAAYGEDEYQWYPLQGESITVKDRFATDMHYRQFVISNRAEGRQIFQDVSGNNPTQLPLWIPPSADSNFIDRTVVLYLENNTASQPAQKLTFRASWDLYTFDQAYSAAVMSSPRVFS